MSSSFRTWTATGVATIASTYLLDLLSAGAGALLVASGLLHGVGVCAASAFLAASYIVWGGALWPSLAANWALLQNTGGSTCPALYQRPYCLTCAHFREVIEDMIFGWIARRFHALQQAWTMAS